MYRSTWRTSCFPSRNILLLLKSHFFVVVVIVVVCLFVCLFALFVCLFVCILQKCLTLEKIHLLVLGVFCFVLAGIYEGTDTVPYDEY